MPLEGQARLGLVVQQPLTLEWGWHCRGKLLIAEELLKHGADIHAPVADGDYWIPPPVVPKAEVCWGAALDKAHSYALVCVVEASQEKQGQKGEEEEVDDLAWPPMQPSVCCQTAVVVR